MIKCIVNSVPSTEASHLFVRDFGTANQRVVGRMELGWFVPTVKLTDEEFCEIAEMIGGPLPGDKVA